MATYSEPILNIPIHQLEFSGDFLANAEMLGFRTISDLLQHPTRELEEMPGFGILLIHEYVSFMEQRGLGHYIDPI